ncbi:sugar phosphate isomerase/epimerase family protein [Streptomyces johnsoniae]|uniref:Sugar phosphate isomerase/epimerase n=1 Tax=Streptomyces johnsoniae TaxID=3075532 RepID=A0ABU2SA33_9ACTN|nr:sugar phosphate isomerase/epimerase [Streptomyces sp. DSM 41886]MDT0445832.1 sugar phosphate isomerase/epimerase [Streptomyces sp. DSM 41886]
MCYGFPDDQALSAARAQRGPGRRAMLRGAFAGAVGAGALAAGVATAPGAHAHTHRRGRPLVPPGRISLQIYSMRDDLNGERGFDETLRAVARIGYPRVEQALGLFGRTAEELLAFYEDIGVRATSSHNDISADEQALETKLRDARTLGQSYMNVPYLDSEVLDDWKRFAEQMNHEAARARRHGVRYGYHNHAHEFTRDLGGGVTPWDVLTSELDPRLVHLEIDIHWAVTGGIESGDGVRDPERFTIDVIRSAPQRVLQYHVKDRDPDTGDTVDVGTGMIDFERIFRAHPVKEYIVENDTPDVTPQQTAEVGYAYLRHGRC